MARPVGLRYCGALRSLSTPNGVPHTLSGQQLHCRQHIRLSPRRAAVQHCLRQVRAKPATLHMSPYERFSSRRHRMQQPPSDATAAIGCNSRHWMQQPPHRMQQPPHRMQQPPHRMQQPPHRMQQPPSDAESISFRGALASTRSLWSGAATGWCTRRSATRRCGRSAPRSVGGVRVYRFSIRTHTVTRCTCCICGFRVLVGSSDRTERCRDQPVRCALLTVNIATRMLYYAVLYVAVTVASALAD
jgi:hypothetical protein